MDTSVETGCIADLPRLLEQVYQTHYSVDEFIYADIEIPVIYSVTHAKQDRWWWKWAAT